MAEDGMETGDGAKLTAHYLEKWLEALEKKLDAQDARHDARTSRLEKRVGQLAESGYVSREKYDSDIQAQRERCDSRHTDINVVIDSIRGQQSLWTGNAQIVRWIGMTIGAAAIVYLINRIPWP